MKTEPILYKTANNAGKKCYVRLLFMLLVAFTNTNEFKCVKICRDNLIH